MGKVLERKSAAKEAAEARKTALDLNSLLNASNDELHKLVESRNGSGCIKRKLKLKK